MRAISIFAAALACLDAAQADQASDFQDKLCILNAAPQVPAIPGLAILASRVTATGAAKIKMVEIDIRAAGVDSTLSYVCDFNGKTVASPRGIIK